LDHIYTADATVTTSAILSTRGGGAPGEVRKEEKPVEVTVDAEELYLPGLLQASITRTNKVGYVCCLDALDWTLNPLRNQ
jgi:hypothetical protein